MPGCMFTEQVINSVPYLHKIDVALQYFSSQTVNMWSLEDIRGFLKEYFDSWANSLAESQTSSSTHHLEAVSLA